jgi:hypothetical protein
MPEIDNAPDTLIPLDEAGQLYGLAYSTMAEAARKGRLQFEWVEGQRCTTRAAVEAAIAAGRLRPRKRGDLRAQ